MPRAMPIELRLHNDAQSPWHAGLLDELPSRTPAMIVDRLPPNSISLDVCFSFIQEIARPFPHKSEPKALLFVVRPPARFRPYVDLKSFQRLRICNHPRGSFKQRFSFRRRVRAEGLAGFFANLKSMEFWAKGIWRALGLEFFEERLVGREGGG